MIKINKSPWTVDIDDELFQGFDLPPKHTVVFPTDGKSSIIPKEEEVKCKCCSEIIEN